MADIEKMLKEFDEEIIFDGISKKKGKRKDITNWAYVDFLANRKRIESQGEGEEYKDIFRADGRIACYRTRTGLETLINKGWQIVRYGNFEAFDAGEDGVESEDIANMANLCKAHLNIRRSVEAQMGIKAKAEKAAAAKGA